MGFYLSVALKNVFRQKKRSFTLGINYAVVTFILVLLFSFSQGAVRNITTNLVRSTAGHITISGSYTAAGRVYHGRAPLPRDRRGGPARSFGGSVTTIPRYVVRSSLYYKGISKRIDFTGIDTDAGLRLSRDSCASSKGGWDEFAVRLQRRDPAEGRRGVLRPRPGRRDRAWPRARASARSTRAR